MTEQTPAQEPLPGIDPTCHDDGIVKERSNDEQPVEPDIAQADFEYVAEGFAPLADELEEGESTSEGESGG